ncbi:MAG: sugar phosphate isomerase/epimerase [Oscillospiraceae bacterium]|nr:sugar phosphate isomerase/epimerase [Oscillospiraceae bacterium]
MAIKWGYSMNAWTHEENSVRKDRNERTFKVMSAGKFKGVELQVGSGRWNPLGRPLIISQIYGSREEFDAYLKGLGIEQIITWDYNPGMMCGEEGVMGRNPSDPAQHEGIVAAVEQFVEFLSKVGAKIFVVRPMNSYWQVAPVTDDKILAAAECWNKVAAMAAKYDVKIMMRPDWFCAANSRHAIDLLMANTDPNQVGLCINTGELAMVELDPVELYEAYADRVGLIQLKDARVADTLQEYKKPFAEEIIKNGGEREIDRWFWEMGRCEAPGLVDFKAMIKAAKDHGYDGWVVVEGDESPDPPASVLFNSWYVQYVLEKV